MGGGRFRVLACSLAIEERGNSPVRVQINPGGLLSVYVAIVQERRWTQRKPRFAQRIAQSADVRYGRFCCRIGLSIGKTGAAYRKVFTVRRSQREENDIEIPKDSYQHQRRRQTAKANRGLLPEGT